MGMTKTQAVRHVILPQALRIVLPSWSNELIYTLLYSSTVYFIGLEELAYASTKVASKTGRVLDSYVIAGVMYLVLVVFLSQILAYAERRLRIPGLSVEERGR
jgi:polar amino acid transport system permease protein